MAVKNFRRRSLTFLLAFLLCVVCLPVNALARGLVDVDHPASITLKYDLSDVAFYLYRVADVSENGDFSLVGDFASYAVDPAGQDSEGWRALADTLAGYAQRDGLEPLYSGSTDQDGKLAFSGLNTGLYLVMGESSEKDEVTYTPMSALISLPGLDEDDEWIYDVTSKVKYDSKEKPPEEELTERKVLKVWKDNGQEISRPKEISVQLLCDGEVYDTVTLSEDNDWRYTWSDLDAKCQWQVVEKEVPKGYTVSESCEGNTFVLTNTCKVPETTPPDETPPDKPSKLPDTGMLWAPVPFLALGGMLLFLIGWFRRRKSGGQS